MKKRILYLVLCLIFVTSLFAACSTKSSDVSKDSTSSVETSNKSISKSETKDFSGRTLEVMLDKGGGGSFYEPIIKRLQELYPGLKVNYWYDLNGNEVFRTRVLANNAPDIFNLNQGLFSYYSAIEEGLCLPLNDILELPTMDNTQKLKDIIDLNLMKQKGYIDGKYYMFPDLLFTAGLWYDAKLLRDNNIKVPTTWDEFMDAAAKLKGKGIYAIGYCGTMAHEYPLSYWFYPMVCSVDYETYVGIQNCDPSAWKSEGMKEVVRRMEELRDKGYYDASTVALGNSETQMQFIARKFAFLPCGSWLEAEMGDAWPDDFELTYLPFSGKKDSSGSDYVLTSSLASSVSSTTKNIDIVGEFYRVFFSDKTAIEGQIKVHQNGMAIKGFGENYGHLLNKSTEQVWKAIDQGVKGFASLANTWYPEYPKQAGNAINALMTGSINGDEFMDRMEALFQSIKDDPNIVKYKFGS
ncbi:MAG TPA: extracellular solute-binding protein [Clostridiaceae bacterium]|nr:extracellular solute-binding protein [Clostridiaceae bacterium]